MPHVNIETLKFELSTFDIDYEDDSVLNKLLEQCTSHHITENTIVCEWVAFSTTRGEIVLNSENLEHFEHEILKKKVAKSRQTAAKVISKAQHTKDISSLQELIQAEVEEENLLDSYSTPAKGSQKRPLSTPENPQSKKSLLVASSPLRLFSPASFSPSSTPSQKYSSRTSRGEIVNTYGITQGTSWCGQGGAQTVVRLCDMSEESLSRNYKYMFQKLRDIRDVLANKIEDLGATLKNCYSIEEFASTSLPAQENVILLGQICCDSNGKLNAKSVVLEGDLEYSCGMQVPVDLSELREYSLFPGQVVVMEGINSTGRKLVASKLYEGVPLPFYRPEEQDDISDEQQMVLVACGPYTTSDSLTYEPLLDLIEIVKRDKPDVCILLGPFLDSKHEQVESYQLIGTFEEVFKRCLKGIIEGTRGLNTQLVFVPSLRDVHHEYVYPQPPFVFPEISKEDRQRVHLVPDPCTLNINGVVFGLTSTDIIFHMGTEEISSSVGSDRFTRILKHILTQRSYYPLYPPAEEMNIDYENFQLYAQMQVTPDVFIVPSELRYFVKDVIGCVCMNPGRLTKGQVGGTYGRLFIKPKINLEKERQNPCLAAQVVKI
ncbi:DNA polymerase alpha subunit B [Polypterus senegalus]|uniref:DNA polymerase alpha subunit B n=1 Tax=Polypterus senegalus TaxID=55291 RepID=UPI001964EC95|nr:DNA polymerase alpha subunit B [Polypterus senegalus]